MIDKVEDLVLEHLKAILARQSASRERDGELLRRVARLEIMIARIRIDRMEAGWN